MKIKICGVRKQSTLKFLTENKIDFAGFVFFPPSPRSITAKQYHELIAEPFASIKKVGLFVNPTDEDLEQVIKSGKNLSNTKNNLDFIQLHGNETTDRILNIKNRFSIPVIKCIPIKERSDIQEIEKYEKVSDWILCDAQAHKNELPGGTGRSFDWKILKQKQFKKPWMLAGGLNTGNVKKALSILNPTAVDVSSGVERSPGKKDEQKILNFAKEVRDPK